MTTFPHSSTVVGGISAALAQTRTAVGWVSFVNPTLSPATFHSDPTPALGRGKPHRNPIYSLTGGPPLCTNTLLITTGCSLSQDSISAPSSSSSTPIYQPA